MTLAAGTRLGPYEVVAPLGAGGMGVVYRARDTRLGREVAVKLLPPSLSDDADRLRRFEQEARATSALNHPNIVALYDVGTQDGAPYVVSELLEGETLRARLASGAMPVRKVIDWAVQFAQGLAAAHEGGIVHRDLKPENVFVTKEGRLKILDFGLAKLIRPASPGVGELTGEDRSSGTEAGTVMGTVGYMSPEQVRGEAADHRSDIFSFGAVIYEMLSGQRAFQGTTAVEAMNAILKEDPPALFEGKAGLPAGLERIVRHCLEKSPEERFQSARDLAFDLSGISGLGAGIAVVAPAPTKRLALAGAGLLALGLVLGAVSARVALKESPIEPPSYRRLTFRRGLVDAARFTSDGQTVVYSAAWDRQPPEVFTGRIGSPEWRSLGVKGNVLAVSSTDELAVLLEGEIEGKLARVPLAGGAPRAVLEGVRAADWSPDGKELAVARRVGGRMRLEYPIGKTLYQAAASEMIVGLRVSPAGDAVAFGDWSEGASVVALVDHSGKKKTLSTGWVTIEGLSWSPDGKEVWFGGWRRGNTSALYAVTRAGQERLVARGLGDLSLHDARRDGRVLLSRDDVRYEMRGLVPGETQERDLSWLDRSVLADLSADGRAVLFTQGGYGDGVSAYVRQTDGSPAVRLGEGKAVALSPDGKWALLTRESPPELLLVPTGAGETKALTLPGLSYSPGGGIFVGNNRIVFAAHEAGHGSRWYVQDLDGGKPRPITPEGAEDVWLGAASPDGRFLAGHRGPKPALFPIDGGEPREVRGAAPGDVPTAWSTDGRSLFLFRFEVPALVYRLDLSSGRRELWKELAPADRAGVRYVSWVSVTPDGRWYAYNYTRGLSDVYLVERLR